MRGWCDSFYFLNPASNARACRLASGATPASMGHSVLAERLAKAGITARLARTAAALTGEPPTSLYNAMAHSHSLWNR